MVEALDRGPFEPTQGADSLHKIHNRVMLRAIEAQRKGLDRRVISYKRALETVQC